MVIKMVVVFVPYPCGTIFSIILIIGGILSLPADPEGGFSMIIFGIIVLAINQAIVGSSRSRGIPVSGRGSVIHNRAYSTGNGNALRSFCPKCRIEYTTTNQNNLCPNCQVHLKTKPTSYLDLKEEKKPFYFENQ
jgi:hypothetical protein